MTVDYKKYKEFCRKALIACGMKEEAAEAVADCCVMTDMLGISTHGTINLPKYIRKMKAGGLHGNTTPSVISEGPTWARLNGEGGFGMYNGRYAIDLAMKKADEMGMALVTVSDSGHFGACCSYSIYAAEKGYLALAMSNTNKLMCVPGGKGNVIGNAPISYALPRPGKHPIFMDIALSQVAKLKVVQYQREGKKVPDGWVVDENGMPTNDPQGNNFSMCPMSAHKGYCLAFFVETLTTVLSGGSFDVKSWLFTPPETQTNTGHTMLVINVNKMMDPSQFAERLEEYTASIVNAPKAMGSDKIFYPGEPNWCGYDAAVENGLVLPDATAEAARELEELSGLKLEDAII
ncbi:MAG: Ldh family oxidoreductase [Ruminococcaceae bacterium]|nr:Ldh family oxidoreductase [Oscillospiraceae bacterium]